MVQWWKEMHNELGLQLKWSSTSEGAEILSKEHNFIDARIKSVYMFSADNLPVSSASTNKTQNDNDA